MTMVVMKSLSSQLMARKSSATSIACNSLSVNTVRYDMYISSFKTQSTIYIVTAKIYALRNARLPRCFCQVRAGADNMD
jgi:hypothetical protein